MSVLGTQNIPSAIALTLGNVVVLTLGNVVVLTLGNVDVLTLGNKVVHGALSCFCDCGPTQPYILHGLNL